MDAQAPLSSSAVAPVLSARQAAIERLKAYRFTKGDPTNPAKHNPKAHRQKGTRDAIDILLEAAPKKARQYVKSLDASVLIDARKWILPTDDESTQPTPQTNLVFIVPEHLSRLVAIAESLERVSSSLQVSPRHLLKLPQPVIDLSSTQIDESSTPSQPDMTASAEPQTP